MNATGEKREPIVVQQQDWQLSMPVRLPVHFVAASPIHLNIKHNQGMKTLSPAPVQKSKPLIPSSLFEIASRFEAFAHNNTAQSAPPLKEISFADLMLHPEKVEAVLKAAKTADRPTVRGATTKRATRKAPPVKTESDGADKMAGHSRCELKTAEFFLDAPGAKSVKLAADFTDWEKPPLDLIKLAGEIWHAAIPLPPGSHSYRFIVDGQWCDYPLSVLRIPNPFGTANAVTIVASTQT